MYSKLAVAVTRKLSKWDVIDNEKFDIYSYSFEILISYSVYFLIFLFTSALTKTFFESLFFLFGFCILRHFAGGYHTSTYIRCHLLFSLSHLIFILIFKLTPIDWYLVFVSSLLFYIVLSVYLFAPVDNDNKPFTKTEFTRFRFKSRLYVILMSTILITSFLLISIARPYIFCYIVGTSFAATSLLAARIVQKLSKRHL